MNELMFLDYGIDIVKKNDDCYIRYDDSTAAILKKIKTFPPAVGNP